MSIPSEIVSLSIALDNTEQQIDAALDHQDRRAFRVWCQRRRSLIARRERALMAAALEVPA